MDNRQPSVLVLVAVTFVVARGRNRQSLFHRRVRSGSVPIESIVV
jgi:hypothetical protein